MKSDGRPWLVIPGTPVPTACRGRWPAENDRIRQARRGGTMKWAGVGSTNHTGIEFQ